MFAAAAASSGCYNIRPSTGGGQTTFSGAPAINPADIAVPNGYRAEAVASGFTYPTGVAFDGDGRPHVTESGYSYGEDFTVPRLGAGECKRQQRDCDHRGTNGPWTGVAFANGAFCIAEGGELEGGRILRVTPDGRRTTLISGLPSVGDHHTNGPVIGPDGWIYFGQGTATNAGVVGEDNMEFGWLKRKPQFHDTPGRPSCLAARTSPRPMSSLEQATLSRGRIFLFSTPSRARQVIKGAVPCGGSIMRIPSRGRRATIGGVGPSESILAWPSLAGRKALRDRERL